MLGTEKAISSGRLFAPEAEAEFVKLFVIQVSPDSPPGHWACLPGDPPEPPPHPGEPPGPGPDVT